MVPDLVYKVQTICFRET